MSKVVVHEDFSTHVNDIALLKLGEFISSTSLKFRFKDSQMLPLSECLIDFIIEERVNLSKYPPACLPDDGDSVNFGKAAFQVTNHKLIPRLTAAPLYLLCFTLEGLHSLLRGGS